MRAAFLFGLAALLSTLGLYVWKARSDNPTNRWFALFTLSLGGWVLGIAGVESGSRTEFFGRVTFASAALIPATLLAFSRYYPTLSPWPTPRVIKFTLGTAAAWSVLSLFTPLVAYNISLTAQSGIVRTPGALYPVFAGHLLVCTITALWAFIKGWQRTRGLARAQLQYLGIGLFLVATGGMTTNLLIPAISGRSSYSWLGPYFTLPLVLLVGHAIIRHRLMDLRLVIHRGLAYVTLVTLLSVVMLFVTRVALVPERTVDINLDILVIVLVTLVTLSVPSQPLISRVIDPYLFRGRVDYSVALGNATHRLGRLMPPSELARELRSIFTELFVPESFGMIARPAGGDALEELLESGQTSRESIAAASVTSRGFSPSVVLVNPMSETGMRRSAHETLRQAGVELVVTLGRRGEMLGAILVGTKRSGDAYFKNDIDFIESLAQVASIALENSLLYRQRIQILEYSDRLLESLDSAVVAVDVSGRITSFNVAAKLLIGLHEAAKGSRLDILPSEIAWALALAISGSWRPREIEVTIDHPIRGQVAVILSTAVLHDDNAISGALVVVTDLSTVKALEENQRRIEHFATMARFYAGIAHEIRSPLAAISNFISMLTDRFDDPEYRETAARLLPMEVARIVRLADRLRLMAPSEDGNLSSLSLTPLLKDLVAMHSPSAEEAGVQLRLVCPDEVPRILADSSQLVQLFVNLMKNAIESMPHGGVVTISVAHVHERADGPILVVRISDEGTGIDPAIRTRIFQPFVTTKPSGTGLGLSICREIADFHRARLSLSPRSDGRGTVALVEFPCLDDRDRRQTALAASTRSGS